MTAQLSMNLLPRESRIAKSVRRNDKLMQTKQKNTINQQEMKKEYILLDI